MARRQETPQVTEEANEPAAALEPGPTQPQVASSAAPAPDSTASSPLGEDDKATVHGTDPGTIESLAQEPLAEQADSSDLEHAELGASTAAVDDQPVAIPNPAAVEIYPMRSYMDEGELRRRGGPAYPVPRRHAEDLVQRKLASLDPLKE